MSTSSEDTAAGARRSLSGLARHSAIYGLAPFVRQAIAALMQRFYTGWLGTAGGGVKEIADFWMVALQQVLGQNLFSAMLRFYFDRRDEEERKRVVTSCTIVVTAFAWIVCGTAILLRGEIAPLLFGSGGTVGSEELSSILELTLFLIPFQLATLAGYHYLQIRQRSELYTSIQTVKLILEVGLNFWFIGAQGLGVRGFLLSMLVGEMLTSLLLTGWMLATLGPRVDFRLLRPILAYAVPLVPMGLCQLGLHQLDRRLLLEYSAADVAQDVTGIYGHGYKISYIVTAMLLGPFVQIWQPWIFAVEDAVERSRLVARVSTYAVLVIAAASLCVILFGRQACVLLAGDPGFYQAYRVVPFVASGYVFWALYHVTQVPLFLAKRTVRLFVINLLALLANVALNAWLIPAQGFVGAGIATLVTFALLALLGMIASRSEMEVPFELGRLGRTLACVAAGAALALWIDALEVAARLAPFQAWTAKSIACVALLAILLVGVLRADERRGLFAWLARRGAG